jgi:hypothetical protein
MVLALKLLKTFGNVMEFVITKFAITKFAITEFVVTEFTIAEFIIIEFVPTDFDCIVINFWSGLFDDSLSKRKIMILRKKLKSNY